jgi:hypothetical protein
MRSVPSTLKILLVVSLATTCVAIDSGVAATAQTMGTLADEPPCTNTPLAPHCVVQDVGKLAELCRPTCPPKPENSTRPTLSGAPVDGGTLTATRGTWTNNPQLYSVEWERCTAIGVGCEVIAAQNDMSYQLRAEDLGRYVRVKVTAANGGGFSFPAYSDPVGPVQPGPPVRQLDPQVAGVPVEGNRLSATEGSWRGTPPFNYGYQWKSCDPDGTNCTPIAGATGASYLLTVEEVGATVQVTVTASNAQGAASASSMLVGPVASADPPGPPAAEDDTVDDESGELQGSWVGLEGGAAAQFAAGAISLDHAIQLSALSGRPMYHCSARVGWTVGELRTIHQEGPDVKQRSVHWSGTTRCTGGAQTAYMHGYTFLNRKSNFGWGRYSTGDTYSSTELGIVMKATGRGKALEGPRRGVKQVEWHAFIELPPDYQWTSEDPLSPQRGINENQGHCELFVANEGSGPKFLNGLSCVLYGHRFR